MSRGQLFRCVCRQFVGQAPALHDSPPCAIEKAATVNSLAAVPRASTHAASYCGIPVPPFSACSSNTGTHSLYTNQAEYRGAGSISVCQKVQDGATIIDRTCGRDFAAWTGSPIYGVGYVGNDSQWTHTIKGIFGALDVPNRTTSAGPTSDSAPPPADVQRELSVFRGDSASTVTTVALPHDQVTLRTSLDSLCLESTLSSGKTCQSYEKALSGNLLMAGICSPDLPRDQVGIYGVAPDGFTTVNAVAENGSTLASTAVTSNTFALLMSKADAGNTHHFETVGAAGARSLGTVLPPDLSC